MINGIECGTRSRPWTEAHILFLVAAAEGPVTVRCNHQTHAGAFNGLHMAYVTHEAKAWAAATGGMLGRPSWRNFRRLEAMAAFRLESLQLTGNNVTHCLRPQLPQLAVREIRLMGSDLASFVEEGPRDLLRMREALDVLVREWRCAVRPPSEQMAARWPEFARAIDYCARVRRAAA